MESRIADRVLDSGLALRVYYPAGQSGSLPVIVFSHGLGGSRLGYAYLGKYWSSRGYVSIHPSHRENVSQATVESLKPSVAELRAMKESIEDPQTWRARPRDIGKAIDAIPQLPALISGLQGTPDGSRVAIAGHSYGAYTTLLCAGARVRIDGQEHDFSEPRASAFIAISPPGSGSRGLDANSWGGIEKPLLVMTGTEDKGVLGEPAAWREDVFRGLRPNQHALVVLDGAEHFTFSGGRPRRPANPSQLRETEACTAWFLDRHLRGAQSAFPAVHGRVEFR